MTAQIIRFPVERRVAAIVASRRGSPVEERSEAEGLHYARTKGLDLREVAAMIRADLRADEALKAACVVASVRLRRFAGGCAIDVTLAAPGVLDRYGDETSTGRALRQHAESIRRSYGYEVESTDPNGDPCLRFFGSTSWTA